MHALIWPFHWIATQLQAQRGAMLPWTPVCFGIGIAFYFSRGVEPSVETLWICGGAALVLMLVSMRFAGTALALVLAALSLSTAGFGVAGWRAHDVSAPVLGWRYYGPVEGRVVALDRSASDAVRVTLDNVRLNRVAPHETPVRVRVSLHGAATLGPPPTPGMRVMTTAHISPASGPVEPGGFDFQRHSWFLQLGGVGYTRVPMLNAGVAQTDMGLHVFRIRMALSQFVRDAMPGDVGGFAAAVTSGDRSGMGQEALLDLRASNLAHLLAISGLHMGLLTGFVFAVLRIGLVLIPGAALRLPTRRIAAVGALMAATGYLALSGGNVSTERAYIMAAVALCAVMLNRRAFSLRSVAIAAMAVLWLRPEALLGPGFQMSFAATAGLVAAFNWIRDIPWKLPRWIQPVSAVVMSSAIAGLATAPYAAAHFNAVSHYGLFANVLSVPVMGAVVVPAAVVAACLAPIGLEGPALHVMGWGLQWILFVAETTADTPGARSFVQGPSAQVLPLLTLGALVVILWQGRARYVGILPIVAAFVVWSQPTRPTLLIADNGGLVGVMTEAGRALSREKGAGFIAQNWLENDGDGVDQAVAFGRWAGGAKLGTTQVQHITGKKAARKPPACAGGILVSNQPLEVFVPNCRVFDPKTLRATGAVALSMMPDGRAEMTTARQWAGDRLWSQWPKGAPGAGQYVRINPTSLP